MSVLRKSRSEYQASCGRVPRSRRAGVTLIELMVVMSLVALLVGITFPSISSGIDSLRLSSGCEATVSFLNAALNRAERRQEVVEVIISHRANRISLRSTDPSFRKDLPMPDGVTITGVLPAIPGNDPAGEDWTRNFLLFPGGTIPRFGIILTNRRGAARLVRVDPITGVPQIENVERPL